MIFQSCIDTPLGQFILKGQKEGLTYAGFANQANEATAAISQAPDYMKEARKQLEAYFAGTLKQFSVPLSLQGTTFQEAVWDAMLHIPAGVTSTYQHIADSIGNSKAVRAVGNAIHHNPISVIIPCHRVIGTDGALRGYAFGLDKKAWLLEHEQSFFTGQLRKSISA